MKKKTLVVQDMRGVNSGDAQFKVKKVTNSIDFKINEYLSESRVMLYCNKPDWTVNITPYTGR